MKKVLVLLAACVLVGCGTTSGRVVEKPPVPRVEMVWECTPLKPLPSDEELIEKSTRELFDLYVSEWLGHEDCYKTLKFAKEKTEDDITRREASK